ncbi:MAG: signal peptidase I [Actinomycetota bacterium]
METARELVIGAPGKHRSPKGPSRFAWLGSMPALIVISLMVAVLVKSLLVQAFFIPSESMQPTLEPGDRVFVNKLHSSAGDLALGDIVVFEHATGEPAPEVSFARRAMRWLAEGLGVARPQNEDYIKRVIGLPGQTVEIKGQQVFVDGEPIDEPYLTDAARACNDDFSMVTVPEDGIFVMGDNRCNSLDSRYGLGFVPIAAVVGDAFVVIWPPYRAGALD